MFHTRTSGTHVPSLPTDIAHCISDALVRSAIVVTNRAASPVTGKNGGLCWRQCAFITARAPSARGISKRAPFAISTSLTETS